MNVLVILRSFHGWGTNTLVCLCFFDSLGTNKFIFLRPFDSWGTNALVFFIPLMVCLSFFDSLGKNKFDFFVTLIVEVQIYSIFFTSIKNKSSSFFHHRFLEPEFWAQIFTFWSRGIDSKEPTPLAYVPWGVSTITLFILGS
jgi:hypothetical protein